MRKLMNKIDRFCYAHPRFGIPNLMLIIVIGNAAVWLLTKMDTTGQIVSLLSGSAQGILHGHTVHTKHTGQIVIASPPRDTSDLDIQRFHFEDSTRIVVQTACQRQVQFQISCQL